MRKLFKIFNWVIFITVAFICFTGVVYLSADSSQKASIEQHALDILDKVREDQTTPDKVIRVLDKVADQTTVVTGEVVPAPTPDVNAFAPYGEPKDNLDLKHLTNIGYSVGYDDSIPSARWSSYRVFPYQEVHLKRPASFYVDERTSAKVSTDEYVRSGYDRGHLTPNYAISVCYGAEAQKETFFLSNIVPQLHALNAGLWKDIEQRIVKRYVERYGEVWVQVGPLYSAHPKMVGRLPVPEQFWMVISEYEHDKKGIRAIAYLVPHEEKWRDAELTRYVVSVRQIEKLTGLNFFPKLPQPTQDKLETAAAPRAW
ncbi:MAG: DNA/RNA non-specific endonuclease [Verrucomicrobia bacterium]|nr:DNA/RNA non-specific endonuclease [Verrucomicrobiota bacterium]